MKDCDYITHHDGIRVHPICIAIAGEESAFTIDEPTISVEAVQCCILLLQVSQDIPYPKAEVHILHPHTEDRLVGCVSKSNTPSIAGVDDGASLIFHLYTSAATTWVPSETHGARSGAGPSRPQARCGADSLVSVS